MDNTMLVGMAVLLLGSGPSWPCTYELHSIVSGFGDATNLALGHIQGVHTDGIHPAFADLDEEELAELRRSGDVLVDDLKSVTFEIEHVFKGAVEPGPITLRFSSWDTDPNFLCYGPILGFTQLGARMFLSLQGPEADGSYRTPVISPWTITVPSSEHPLFHYVQYVAEHGRSPIQFRFEGPSAHVSGQPLNVEMVIENHMAAPISIKLSGDYPSHLEGTVAFLHLRTGGVTLGDAVPDLIEVKAAGTSTMALGEYFQVGNPGRHGWSGVLSLPTGRGEYRDHWEGNIFEFTATEATTVEADSWARIKAVESN